VKANGEIFKTFRKHLKLTQSQMAAFLNVDQTEISGFEKNLHQLSIDLIERSADLFGCSVQVFFEEGYVFSASNLRVHRGRFDKNCLIGYAQINRIVKNLESMEKLYRNEN
jgi:transcriptional regulator with XRE-family HTH domain